MQHHYLTPTLARFTNMDMPTDYYKYIIITDSSLAHVFQRLIDYKSKFLPSKLVILDNILTNQSFHGRDEQEKIRNFITYAYNHWNTKYVLLGGDDSIIPHRKLHGDMIDWQGRHRISDFPSDMYYGCLDGNWDDDADYIYGEQATNSLHDEADFHAEVYVGRAPVENSYEASIFINKVIVFETSERPTSIQLHQSGLNPENNPSSHRIIENCLKWIPKDKYTVEKFYSIFQNITVQKWIDSFNDGKLIVQHAGNGAAKQYDLDNINDNEVWTIQNISKLRNNFYPIHFSIACHSGDFTVNDCIAEKMLLYPYGGASACIFNSNFGATDRSEAYNYSGEFLDRQFFEMFENNTAHLGEVVQKSKEYFSQAAIEDPKYRWCSYTINLLGDPETPVFERRDYESTSIFSVDDDFDNTTKGWNKTRFSTIQSAINQVDEEGTILVYNGNYQEQLTITKSVYLFGTNKNFEDDQPYSGLTEIIGNGSDHVITIRANNVYIDGFIVKNGGDQHAGVYFDHVNNSFLYRCDIVSNRGHGIVMNASSQCNLIDSSISFNDRNGIILENAHFNYFEKLTLLYNKDNGIVLNHSHHNELIGIASPDQSAANYYGSKIFIKNQDLDLNKIEDLKSYLHLFFTECYYDAIEFFYYFPVRPPISTDNLITCHYFFLIQNKHGVILRNSYNNTLEHLWIECKEGGAGIQLINCSSYPNRISSNFIYQNNVGLYAENSSIQGLIQNNFYNNNRGLYLTDCSGISLQEISKISFLLGGNAILNEKDSLQRFQWFYYDHANDQIYIDAICLVLLSGYTATSIILSLLSYVSAVSAMPMLTTSFLLLLSLTLSVPFALKYIKITHPVIR